jgi:flagellar hook protein FlgE
VYAQDGSVAAARRHCHHATFDNNGTLTGGGNINITTGTIRCDAGDLRLSFLNSMQQNTGANNVVATIRTATSLATW